MSTKAAEKQRAVLAIVLEPASVRALAVEMDGAPLGGAEEPRPLLLGPAGGAQFRELWWPICRAAVGALGDSELWPESIAAVVFTAPLAEFVLLDPNSADSVLLEAPTAMLRIPAATEGVAGMALYREALTLAGLDAGAGERPRLRTMADYLAYHGSFIDAPCRESVAAIAGAAIAKHLTGKGPAPRGAGVALRAGVFGSRLVPAGTPVGALAFNIGKEMGILPGTAVIAAPAAELLSRTRTADVDGAAHALAMLALAGIGVKRANRSARTRR